MSAELSHSEPSSDGSQNSTSSRDAHKRLPDFILENVEHIVGEWEDFARNLTSTSSTMTPLALRDHINEILAFVVDDIKSDQTDKEETTKSRGRKARTPEITAAETHAALRLSGGFNIGQMTSEYRALRASVIKLWRRQTPYMDAQDFADLTRFNESIDQVLTESVSYYATEVFHAKDLFVGILSHDLRNPVQAIMMSAELMLLQGKIDDRQTMLTRNVLDGSKRIVSLIDTLLDVTRSRLGAGLTLIRRSMDMGFVGNQIVDEMRTIHPTRTILLDVSGNVNGEWDKPRVGQVFSNLLGNAIQYGFKSSPIDVVISGDAEAVTLTVHNKGVPIAADKIQTIFDPLTRAPSDGTGSDGSMNLGLGLFITQEIVLAHGGTIQVASTEEKGTTFTARFPRVKTPPALYVAA